MNTSLRAEIFKVSGIEPSVRLTGALRGDGIFTLQGFMDLTLDEAKRIPNIGKATLDEIIAIKKAITGSLVLGNNAHDQLLRALQRIQNDLETVKYLALQQVPDDTQGATLLQKSSYLPTALTKLPNPSLQLFLLGYIFQ
jgi:hypothetical protein